MGTTFHGLLLRPCSLARLGAGIPFGRRAAAAGFAAVGAASASGSRVTKVKRSIPNQPTSWLLLGNILLTFAYRGLVGNPT